MSVKVFEHTVKVHAWGSVEVLFLFEFPVLCDISQDASLAVELSLLFSRSHKRIVVKTVVINVFHYIKNTVRVDFFNIVCVSCIEVLASGRFWVSQAGSIVVADKFGVDEIVVNHILYAVFVQLSIFKTDDSISDHKPEQVNLGDSIFPVICINSDRQIRNVLARIGLSGNPEGVLGILRVILEEVEQCRKVVVGCVQIIVLVVGVLVSGVAYTGRGFQKEEVGKFMPGVGVGGQFVADLVMDAVLKEVWADLLYKAE